LTPALAGPAPSSRSRLSILARGAVQGVGFRPFVCRSAVALGLAGFVRNGPGGVEIEAEGSAAALGCLLAALRAAPAPARLTALETRPVAVQGGVAFHIVASESGAAEAFSLLPDLVTCDACTAEVLDPADRRHRHAFASCARCGPRYSVAGALPWDRARTSMAAFMPCARCRAEHDDPGDRRFHAQTLACPDCGPRLAVLSAEGRPGESGAAALAVAVATLQRGGILAAKGLGGFQLFVDARDEAAVRRLRARKRRPDKPLALMLCDVAAVSERASLTATERAALCSAAGPIVLARRREASDVAPSVAPGVAWLGVMLPTTALHRLLLEDCGGPLVATSGNLAGEPLCATDDAALAALGDVADTFLTHDRPIVRPVDDSVVREIAGRIVTLRCARGLAPTSIVASEPLPPLAALGGDLKAAAAVASGTRIVLGPHVGDLESARTQDSLLEAVRGLSELAGVVVPRLAVDAHPDGHAGRVARAADPAAIAVGHHHAHVLSCVAEHGAALPVLGVAWDGTGYGGDGTVWGGELLRVTADECERLVHLRHFRLPGGTAAVREPRRAALGALWARFGAAALARDDPPVRHFSARDRAVLGRLLASGRFAPETSSAGRLFDAASALLDVRQLCSYEGQAALELESLAVPDPERRAYPMTLRGGVLDWEPLLDALLEDRAAGVPRGVIAMRFHLGLACGIVGSAVWAARETGVSRVVLSGGCFQNALLSELAERGLVRAGLEPLLHHRVPPGDGGLAVGQLLAAGAAARRPEARAGG
jgi:hydrogenase maturation protein HypF